MDTNQKQTQEQVLNVLWSVLYSKEKKLAPTIVYYILGFNLILPQFSLFHKINKFENSSHNFNFQFERKVLLSLVLEELKEMNVQEDLYMNEVLNAQLLD